MLEELKKFIFQSGRDEIIYFLCKVIGASSINRNDAIVLCNHAPGKHHLSCDDLITYCSAFGWIRFSENKIFRLINEKSFIKVKFAVPFFLGMKCFVSISKGKAIQIIE